MAKIKHNKIKNTGILFEALARQITADVLEDKKSSVSSQIIKEHFNKNTELRKEVQLYHSLIKEKFISEVKASSFVDMVVDARKKLNNSKLRREKFQIIKKLKENFSIENLFSSRIEAYPVYASIYKLFEYSLQVNEATNPTDLVNAKFTVVDHLIRKTTTTKAKNPVVETLAKEPMQVRVLTQQIIVDNFNRAFSNKLSEEQKLLVRDYINNVSNTNPLNEAILKRLPIISKKLAHLVANIPDDAIKIKVAEVKTNINKLKNFKTIKDSHVLALLRTYSLIDEITNHMKQQGCSKKTLVEKKK